MSASKHKEEKAKPREEPPEKIYIIESLLKKNGSKFLVKWENYPKDYNSWEPRSCIPPNIVQVSAESRFSEEPRNRVTMKIFIKSREI